ncbi:hypothetical protein AB2M62_16500 [Sphingomonas sp. MMS12-HWE2-04]|uniref:hypothetical protein n=1 Tax=Sphingomonas sp. MMS12-HWE2-04 TaxID=3234199 RepID=UPI00384F9D80
MFDIPVAAVPVVADETRTMLHATDRALLAHASLLTAVIESAQTSNLPIGVTQALYSRIMAQGGKLVEGREDLRGLIAQLTAVKNRSNQKEVATGCPNGLPDAATFFTEAKLGSLAQDDRV